MPFGTLKNVLPRNRALSLVIGRACLVIILMLGHWWRIGEFGNIGFGASSDSQRTVEGLFFFLTASLALTALYAFLLRFSGSERWLVRVQFVIDAALITWLIWLTGDLASPYITLYIVLVSVAGFFLGKNETLYLAILCAAVFSVFGFAVSSEAVATYGGEAPSLRAIPVVGANVVAILLVGLLSARLAERRRIADELKHSEESFADLHILHERIVESISTGLVTTDLEGRIYSFNSAAERITGLAAADALGRSVGEIFPPELVPPPGADATSLPAAREAAFGRGKTRIVAKCSVLPLLNKEGEPNGLILMLQDITQLREMETNLRRRDRLAAVGRMAAGLAHEIRNPLGSMSSAIQFLQEREGRRPEDAALMSVVQSETDRMNGIITSFLSFARPAANGIDPDERTRVDLTECLRDSLALLRHSPDVTERHEIAAELPERPLMLDANEVQIKQVIWNLALNAVQAMEEGGRLAVRAEERAGGGALITFRDTGPGIPEHLRENLFEPFTSGSGGTGLGLSIVYNIVREHGGNIRIESPPEGGTCVRVELAPAAGRANGNGNGNGRSAHS